MSPSHTLTPIVQTLTDSPTFQVLSGCTCPRWVSASSAAAEVGAGQTSRGVAAVRRRPWLGEVELAYELAQPRGSLVVKWRAQPPVAGLWPCRVRAGAGVHWARQGSRPTWPPVGEWWVVGAQAARLVVAEGEATGEGGYRSLGEGGGPSPSTQAHQDLLASPPLQGTVAGCCETGQPSPSRPGGAGRSCLHNDRLLPTGITERKPCPQWQN